MSIDTNTAFSKSQDLYTTTASPRGGLNPRTRGADGAPGFAQVLHAFDSSSRDEQRELFAADADRPSVTDEADSESDLQQEQIASDEASDASDTDSSDEQKASSNETANEQGTEPATIASPDAADVNADQKVANTSQIDPQAQAQAHPDAVATTSKQAAQLDLLAQRGDQAKLSMRGLVQSLKAQSSPDLTTIAVQTRTGQIEQPVQAGQAGQAQSASPVASNDVPEPDFAPPVPQSIGSAGRNPGDSLSDQPPQSTRGPDDPALRPATPVAYQTTANQSELDPSRVDAQQSRSTRADAAQVSLQPRNQIDFSRSGIDSGVTTVATQNRVDGALTERAVRGVESGIAKDAITPLDQQTPKAGQLSNTQPESVRASVMAQVQRGLASLLRSSSGDMTLRLTPSHLGTVQISVKRDGDRISIRMTASTPEARDLLSVGSKELMQTLEAKGVKVENFLLDMKPDDLPGGDVTGFTSGFGGDRDASSGQHQSGNRARPKADGEDVIPFEGHAGEHDINRTNSIWSELGLDAIA